MSGKGEKCLPELKLTFNLICNNQSKRRAEKVSKLPVFVRPAKILRLLPVLFV